ncbi:hypothetical protein BpHYR1_021392 [Brachionus plicatilis]|uniref:Uncharacterized protein n=1 Tax=Brachionus plicatilis TaxID=10195 RepID=A0A3M7QB72_BRAPC|nr:hypothetical protein BpHYR1_021392 [Brachionus plicatilis]
MTPFTHFMWTLGLLNIFYVDVAMANYTYICVVRIGYVHIFYLDGVTLYFLKSCLSYQFNLITNKRLMNETNVFPNCPKPILLDRLCIFILVVVNVWLDLSVGEDDTLSLLKYCDGFVLKNDSVLKLEESGNSVSENDSVLVLEDCDASMLGDSDVSMLEDDSVLVLEESGNSVSKNDVSVSLFGFSKFSKA